MILTSKNALAGSWTADAFRPPAAIHAASSVSPPVGVSHAGKMQPGQRPTLFPQLRFRERPVGILRGGDGWPGTGIPACFRTSLLLYPGITPGDNGNSDWYHRYSVNSGPLIKHLAPR